MPLLIQDATSMSKSLYGRYPSVCFVAQASMLIYVFWFKAFWALAAPRFISSKILFCLSSKDSVYILDKKSIVYKSHVTKSIVSYQKES
jgi:hypothetical protein